MLARAYSPNLIYESLSHTLSSYNEPVGREKNAFSQTSAIAYALGASDIDNDGDLDLMTVSVSGVELYTTTFCPNSARGETGPCFMCPTFSKRAVLADRCEECPPHHHAPSGVACEPCASGQERSRNTHECVSCSIGTAGGFGSPCTECPVGYYADAAQLKECSICPAGKFSASVGSGNCTVCTVGDFCPEGASAPQPCDAGRYGDTTGRTDSKCSGACAPGHCTHHPHALSA